MGLRMLLIIIKRPLYSIIVDDHIDLDMLGDPLRYFHPDRRLNADI